VARQPIACVGVGRLGPPVGFNIRELAQEWEDGDVGDALFVAQQERAFLQTVFQILYVLFGLNTVAQIRIAAFGLITIAAGIFVTVEVMFEICLL